MKSNEREGNQEGKPQGTARFFADAGRLRGRRRRDRLSFLKVQAGHAGGRPEARVRVFRRADCALAAAGAGRDRAGRRGSGVQGREKAPERVGRRG